MSKNIRGLQIQIGAETTGLDKALADVNKSSKDINKELRDVNRLLRFNPKDTELLAQKKKLLGDQVSATREKLDKLKEAEKQVQEQFKKGEITEEQYRAFQREIVETTSKLKHYENQLKEVNKESNVLSQRMQEIGGKMKGVGDKISSTGKGLTTKLTLPLAGVAGAAAKLGIDFEKSMSEVAAVTGATGDELEQLEKAARDAGATTDKSARDAADALKYMGLAGWDVEKSQKALMPVLKLSSAGNLDLGRTSELVTNSMGAMGIEIDELNDYLDIMAQTSRNSDTDIDQLAEGFLHAGNRAKNFRTPVEDTATALGVLANEGMKGAEGGRALDRVLGRLTAPTGKVKDEFERLGIEMFDLSTGEFVGMENALKNLEKGMEGMDMEQRNAFLTMVAGQEHSKALGTLLDSQGGKWDELSKDVGGYKGALDDMYDTATDNTMGAIKNLTSALEELSLKIFENLQPTIEKLVAWVQKITDKFNALSPETQENIVRIGLLVAAIGPLLMIFGKLTSGIGNVIGIGGKLIGNWDKIKGAGSLLSGGLTKSVGFLFSPQGAILVGIAAVIAGGIALYKNWDVIKEKAQQFKENLSEKWNDLKEKTTDAWENMKKTTSDKWEDIKKKTSETVESVRKNVSDKWENIQKKTSGVWKAMTENTSERWGNIKSTIEKNGGGIEGVIKTYTETYKKVWDGAFSTLDRLTGGRMSDIVSSVSSGLDRVKSFFSNLKLKPLEIPKPKLPRFSLTGSFSLKPPSVPRISVDWYKKGAIFTKPTIFGTHSGFKGVGEAGAEAVLPIEKLSEILADTLDRIGQENSTPAKIHSISEINHTGTLRVEGVNNRNELTAVVDIVMDELRREVRT